MPKAEGKDNDMFILTLLDEKNESAFLPALTAQAARNANLIIGVIETETDTACGVLAAELRADGERDSFVILQLTVAEEFRGKGAESAMLRYLEDITSDIGCSSVYASELIMDGEESENEQYYLGTGFYVEDRSLPLKGFTFSDISVRSRKSDCACIPLMNLSDEDWDEFQNKIQTTSFYVGERSEYDKSLSTFLFQKDRQICGGILVQDEGQELFIDCIAIFGRDEEALFNDLFFELYKKSRLKKQPDTIVRMYQPSGFVYQKMLQEMTAQKAKTVGKLVNYTYVVPAV